MSDAVQILVLTYVCLRPNSYNSPCLLVMENTLGVNSYLNRGVQYQQVTKYDYSFQRANIPSSRRHG